MATEPNYGSDLSCTTDLNPTFRLVSGQEMMGQVILRRLYCRRGGLLSAPNAITLDARDFLSTGFVRDTGLRRIAAQCEAAILGDPRVFSVTVTATFTAETRTLLLSCRGVGATGPFFQTLRVSELTIDILRGT